MFDSMKKFAADEEGATAVEYAFLASLVAMLLIAALTAIGTHLQTTFNEVSANLK
jgi:pilus assembly protein Flp/PilA